MNIENFNHNLENNNNNSKNFITNFIKELGNALEKLIEPQKSLSEDTIFVVRDINDKCLTVVNIENGNEFEISDNISKEVIDNLSLGSALTFKDGKYIPYNKEFKIKNSEAMAKLDDMYFCLEDEKNAVYSVKEISQDKIYLTNVKEGGFFSIPKSKYPDFKLGDLVKNENGKYVLQKKD